MDYLVRVRVARAHDSSKPLDKLRVKGTDVEVTADGAEIRRRAGGGEGDAIATATALLADLKSKGIRVDELRLTSQVD